MKYEFHIIIIVLINNHVPEFRISGLVILSKQF